MKNKRFTLIELIVAVIIIALIASIVVAKILDMKSKSIGAAVSNNTKIIQTAVDRYALDNNGLYPIKNSLTVTLPKPQLIDVGLLKEKGYLKKDLDITKVKKQYYWLDAFGIAWGSTEKVVEDITSITGRDGKTHLEFITPTGAAGYRIYEVTGYNKSGNIINQKDRHYKLVTEVELNKKRQKVNFEIPDSSKTYLISAIDKYEQETAPVGVFYKGPTEFKPILYGDGKYEFEIESYDEMFWINFKTVEEKPGNSSITYRFKVKDKEGIYMDWTDDFFSLPSSTGIKTEVTMKGDSDGNKPSLYDLNVMYRYAYEENLPQPPIEFTSPEKTSDICPSGFTTSNISDDKWIEGQPKLYTYLVNLAEGQFIEKIRTPYFKGYNIKNIRYEYADENGNYLPTSGTFDIPSGSCVNIIFEVEDDENENFEGNKPGSGGPASGGSSINPHSPDIVICKDKCASICDNCVPVCMENCKPSCDSKDCVKEEDDMCKVITCIEPPVCIEGDVGCVPPVCTDNCSDGPPSGPNPQDAELSDPNWTTLERLRFFAHGPLGTPTRWIGMEPTDIQDPGKTRIVYRYAKSNGSNWSGEIDELNKVGQSKSLMVIAYLQIHKDVKNDPKQKPPEVISIKITHEKGSFDLSMVLPTLAILPNKNNNEGRDVFSDESVFDWQYRAADPKGRKITEVQWRGDKLTKYPVGTYEVEARVKNETELWSEWVKYKFDVVSEKPVAVISRNTNIILKGKEVLWSHTKSIDPDGDKIVNVEWKGDKQTSYKEVGDYTLSLRVQDSEGYWSDWVEEKISVYDKGLKVVRIEAEDSKWAVLNTNSANVVNSNYSAGKYAFLVGLYSNSPSTASVKFTGSAFDAYLVEAINLEIYVDNNLIEKGVNGKNFVYSITGIEDKEHTFTIKSLTKNQSGAVDYFDVYSNITNIEMSDLSIDVKESGGVISHSRPNFSNTLGESIHFSYYINRDGKEKITILNSNGDVVRTREQLTVTGASHGFRTFTWDGKDKNGEYVDTDDYTVKWDYVGVDGTTKTSFTQKVAVDANRPVARIEGEDLTRTVHSSHYSPVSDPSYSGGQAAFIQGQLSSHSSSFKMDFIGTGIDIHFIDTTNQTIKIDGVDLDTVTYNIPTTHAIRNLSDGKHSLEIYGSKSRNKNGKIDYVDIYNDSKKITISKQSQDIVNSTKEVARSGNDLRNQIGNSVLTSFTVDKDGKANYVIKNSSNNIVYQKTSNIRGGSYGDIQFYWAGTNNNGELVPSGTYTLELELTDLVGAKTNKTFYYKVENAKPFERVEAEDKTRTVIVSKRGNISDPTYSGGLAVFLEGQYSASTSSLEFKFVGTGVDIKFINSTNQTIAIDGVDIEDVNFGTERLYSIANLNQGEHTLKIYGFKSSAKQGRIDYIDVYK